MKDFRKKIIGTFFVLTSVMVAAAFTSENTYKSDRNNTLSSPRVPIELPATSTSDVVIHHSGFSLLYNEAHEQAVWVAHYLTRERVMQKNAERKSYFSPDKKIATGSAKHSDYTKTGFDRGHLVPAADMAWSEQAMAESFFTSNISPQEPNLNRNVWRLMEEQIREWAQIYDTLYIVTGPILETGLPTIGESQVSVPKYFYKLIVDVQGGRAEGIAFLMPNTETFATKEAQDFVVPIDSIETLTGIDFYPLLNDATEKEVEQEVCLECWEF